MAFYVSEKDISLLSSCNTRNYSLALERIDGYLLKPGELFNANRELAKVRGYCTGRGETNFLFYGGVCGMSAQVFRTTLIHPTIEITKRSPHNERFVQYYGAEIGGDDAAVYEMSKQFEVMNIGDEDIYFRVKWGDKRTELVAISPRSHQWVEITKFPISEREIELERKIWNAQIDEKSDFSLTTPIFPQVETSDILVKQEVFHSLYYRKNYEIR